MHRASCTTEAPLFLHWVAVWGCLLLVSCQPLPSGTRSHGALGRKPRDLNGMLEGQRSDASVHIGPVFLTVRPSPFLCHPSFGPPYLVEARAAPDQLLRVARHLGGTLVQAHVAPRPCKPRIEEACSGPSHSARRQPGPWLLDLSASYVHAQQTCQLRRWIDLSVSLPRCIEHRRIPGVVNSNTSRTGKSRPCNLYLALSGS